MSDVTTRGWLFNKSKATAAELVLARAQKPFILDCSFTYKLYSTVHQLANGFQLGLVLSWAQVDNDMALVAPFDTPGGPYEDNRYSVIRLVAATCRDCVFTFEFSWLISGALSIRFHPYVSTSSQSLLNYTFRTFSPEDATLFTLLAECERPSVEFMKARFDEFLLLRPWYEVEFTDVLCQDPCKFCVVRGFMHCECPIIMRRRTDKSTYYIMGSTSEPNVNERNSVWTDVGGVMDCTSRTGSLMFNIKIRTSPTETRVPKSGIVPFGFSLYLGITQHQVLHQFMAFSGSTMAEPTRLILASIDPNVESNDWTSHPNSSASPTIITQPDVTALSLPTNASTADFVESSSGSNSMQYSRSSVSALQMSAVTSNTATQLENQTSMNTDINSSANTVNVGGSIQLERVVRDAVLKAMREVDTPSRAGGSVKKKKTDKVFTCPDCGLKVYNKRSNLTRHIQNRHEKLRKFPCQLEGCGKRFQTKSNLDRHVRNVHAE